ATRGNFWRSRRRPASRCRSRAIRSPKRTRRWPTYGPVASKAPPCLSRELRSLFGDTGHRQRNEAQAGAIQGLVIGPCVDKADQWWYMRSCYWSKLRFSRKKRNKAGGVVMSHAKDASKRKRLRKAVPTVGIAGMSLAMAGGASAATAPPTANLPSQYLPLSHEIILGEEEISDVSLGTFYVFDKEDAASELGNNIQLARGGGRGGGGGCGGRGGGGRGCGGA